MAVLHVPHINLSLPFFSSLFLQSLLIGVIMFHFIVYRMPIIEEVDSGIDANSATNSREDSPTSKKDMANMIEDDPVRVFLEIKLYF